jgi:outer membrane receptor for ferrienterochelin and colicin
MKRFYPFTIFAMLGSISLLSRTAIAAEGSSSESRTGTQAAPSAGGIGPADEVAPQPSRDGGAQADTETASSDSGPFLAQPALPSPAAGSAAQSANELDLPELALPDLSEIQIPEVLGVSKMREDARQAPMSVYTVTREELDRWGTRGVLETLQRVPGFSYYNIDQYGQYGALSRGLYSIWRFGQSLELMPFIDHGHTVFAPRMFQSVEVARGPSGLTWGRTASAGLINYTLREDLDGSEATVELGDHARRATDVMVGAKLGKNDNFFFGFHYEEQGFETQTTNIPFTNSPIWRSNGIEPDYILASRLKYKLFKGIIYYESGGHPVPHVWFGDAQGLESALAARGHAYPVDRLPNLNWRLELHAPTEALTKRASFVKTLDPYFYFNGSSSEWWVDDVVGVTHHKYDLGVLINGTLFEGNRVRFSIGGDFWSRNTGTDEAMITSWAHDTMGVNWFDGQTETNKNYARNAFAQTSVGIIDQLSIVAGGRIDYLRDEINNGQLVPNNAWTSTSQTLISATRLGAIYTPYHSTTLKYMFNTTKRPPAFNEKFGNPTLSPELTSAHEVIAMYQKGKRVQADLTIAYQSLTDMINRVEGSNFNTFANAGNSKTWAIEWDAKYRLIPQLLVYWNGSWNRARGASGQATLDGVTSTVAPPSDAQQRLRFVPAVTSFIGAEYLIAGTVNVNADFRAITRIPYRTLAGTDGLASAYFVDVTARTKQFWRTVSLSFSALNLFNAKPNLPAFGEHAGNVDGTLQPEGRRVFARLTASF